MAKTLLYRLFGLGGLSADLRAALDQEGIVLLDEGISGAIVFKNFRAPGRYHGWRWSWFSGSLVVTERRFAAYTSVQHFTKIIDVPFGDPHMRLLEGSVGSPGRLVIRFDAGEFHESWSGSIECRFNTPLARSFLERLELGR
ncbi:MAG: hypothetical protein JRG76_15700 [Deltaproteobacteria bacterium]|nr:hypothetical protein [Deltaproteobacteria bacterium]MBW2415943.1 hypothetical protein [Deltaproteobacteria bacterium]